MQDYQNNWSEEIVMSNEIEVSIYCFAFNHERYIRKALEGFVNQKTSFEYEVIVHDDASTDGTARIIAEYADKYPKIIKPIFQSVNQYSKGVSILNQYIAPKLQSTKYYAVCEGDDYWLDNNKLQIQYEYMETHSACSLCVHNTKIIAEDGTDLRRLINPNISDKDYHTEEIIKAGGGGLFHTSSFFWRKEFGLHVPNSFKIKGIGDFNHAIYLSTVGDVHYFGKVMSAYRQGSVNSWVKDLVSDRDKHVHHYELLVEALERMNHATQLKYDESFRTVIKEYKIKICEMRRDYKTIFSDPILLEAYKRMPLKRKIKIRAKMLLQK